MSILKNYADLITKAIMTKNDVRAIELADALSFIFEDITLYESLYCDYSRCIKEKAKDNTAWVTENDMAYNYYYLYVIMNEYDHKHIVVRKFFEDYLKLSRSVAKDVTLKYISENIKDLKNYYHITIIKSFIN